MKDRTMKSCLFLSAALLTMSSYSARAEECYDAAQGRYVTLNNANGLSRPVVDDNSSGKIWSTSQDYGDYLGVYGGIAYNGYHPGEDWNRTQGDLGEPVYSAGDGKVVKVTNLGYDNYGRWIGYLVVVKHVGSFRIPAKSLYAEQTVNTIYSAYTHVDNPVALDSCVYKGKTVIGKIMNHPGGPHLHLEIAYRPTANLTPWWPNHNGLGYYATTAKLAGDGFKDPKSVISANPPLSSSPKVSLVAPSNAITGISPTNVAFSWTSQNATNHRIVLSTTSNFSGFVDTGDGSSYCSNAATCYTTTTSSSTSYTKTLSAGTTYYWKVRASGSGGNAWSSAWNFTTASATSKPVAPTGLSASASGTSITFRWNDVSSNESGFRVYRWNGSTWASQAATAANATSYTNTGLSSNTTYYYTVCSYNSAGDSCASNYAYATTGSSGSVPSSVSVNPSSGSWTSNQNLAVTSTGATTIYYKMVNTYDGSTPSDPSSPSASSNSGRLSGPSAMFELWGKSGYLKKSKLRFIGCNNYGCGSVSGVYSYSIDQRSTVSKPAAPGSQSAAATSSSSITLRWNDLSSNESGFRPYRWNGSSWSSLGNVSANSTSYVNSGLSASTTYYYYICSYNSAGESCPSNYVQATTTSSGSSGSSWDGKSPSGTACEQDATTVASRSNSYGKVQLRWSSTCKTNWTRVVPNSSSYSTSGKIRRTSDGRSYTTSGTGTRFTKMVYAPTVQACASGSIKGYSLSEVCR